MENEEEGEQNYNGSGIVYCRTRNDTMLLSRELRTRGISCKAYHAGLSVSNENFLSLQGRVISRFQSKNTKQSPKFSLAS